MSPQTTDLVNRLRDPCEAEGQDMHIRCEAADEIERLERERSEWAGVAATRNRNIAMIAGERDTLRNALIDARSWILDSGQDVSMAPAIEGIDRALGCFRPSALDATAPSILTWRERCATHPEHQNGAIITSAMINRRMQEEIDDLRAALGRKP